MNIKNHLRDAWNQPRLFFFYLALLCVAGLGLAYIFEVNTSNFHPSRPLQSLAAWIVLFLALGTVAGIAGLILSWIPPVRRFLHWVLRRRFFVVALLITLIALFYTEENVRGKMAWKKVKRNLEAKGERVDLASFAPPPVLDNQNFAMAPIWIEQISAQMGAEKAKKWYGDKVAALGHTNFVSRLEMPLEIHLNDFAFTNNSGNWQKAEKADLELWQEYYRKLATVTNVFPDTTRAQTPATAVLLALSKYDSAIEDLRAASLLPYSRFPLTYTDENPAAILLPHLAVFKNSITTLRLRACAELQAGATEKALEDIKLMLRLTHVLRKEPTLISHLVSIAMVQLELQPIWEGLADRRWNEAQLAALEGELSKVDVLADYQFAMRSERAFGVSMIDYLRRNQEELGGLEFQIDFEESNQQTDFTLEKMLSGSFNLLVPGGWFEHNKVAICRMHSDYLLPIMDLENRVVSVAAQKRAVEATTGSGTRVTPYNMFTRFLLPALNNVPQKSARAQASIDLARVACALERYRLANGNYPSTLDSLVPQFLPTIPQDLINGKPLNYRPSENGAFILYSVGWNENDDGGKVELTRKGKVDDKKGDWVWKSSAQ